MDFDTGSIYFFSDYKHSGTGTIKERHAMILVSKEVTDFVHGCCDTCNSDCKIYTSPIEKHGNRSASFLLPKKKYSFLDIDRYCNIISSNLQKTCHQRCNQRGKISKEDIPAILEEIKTAFKTTDMPREISDPFSMGMIIHQWVELSERRI